MRTTICAVVIEENKILIVKKEYWWILPGGKPNDGEDDITCLCREFSEELSGTELKNIEPYGSFTGIAPHRRDRIRANVYIASLSGELGEPSSEICGKAWASKEHDYQTSDITEKIIQTLEREGYLS